jgi:hypothetical protein
MNKKLNKSPRRISSRPVFFFSLLTVVLFIAMMGLTFVRDRFLRGPNDFITVSVIVVMEVFFLLSFLGFILSLIPRTRPFMAWLLGDFWFWLFTWPRLRVVLVGMVALATLIAIFYTEENWRGKRAWENCKRELEAKGAVLDWDAYIPPPVPDDQNFFKAPKMQKWFVKLNKTPAEPYTNELRSLWISTNIMVTITNEIAAAKYLAWSSQFETQFDEIREALKRPYARMDGDYSKPFEIPIPSFVSTRALAQVLAQRTKCYLLLGQPEKALNEVTLLNDSRKFLEGAPTGRPMTLVAAMINVAVTGLYVDTIANGLQSSAWQQPQMTAIQEQLEEINLNPLVLQALQEEPSAVCHDLEIVPLYEFFNFGRTPKWTDKMKSWLWPRGWTYQNMVNVAVLELKPLDGFDIAHDTVAPRKFDEASRWLDKFLSRRWSPYKLLAAMAIPNFTKAEQTAAYNQTLVNEAQIACALERYHLAHGEYPETLDALAPQFMEKIPHDIIGGQPLHYRRTDDGKFLLYSVGWNETDDGGLPGTLADVKKGDWVWPYPQK